MGKGGYVYILSNKYRTVFYIGVTNDIRRRIYEHRYKKGSKFTNKYKVKDLMYYESYSTIEEAIHKEKQLKKWKRSWKLDLIQKDNPDLLDLAGNWFTESYD